jgi:galactose mutarotase-like enzyme
MESLEEVRQPFEGEDEMSAYGIQLDDDSGIDRVLNRETGARLMLNRLGAELIGYRISDRTDGREIPLMYRDSLAETPSSGWKNHATVLFPIVGGLKNKVSKLGSATISTPGNHGVARHSLFEVIETSAEGKGAICYRLRANNYTREYYPFDFQLDLRFELVGLNLAVIFEILNPGSERIHYCFGWHPGFSTPFLKGTGQKTDCQLIMPSGNIRKYHNNEYCRLTGETSMMAVGGPLDWTEEGLELTYMYEIDDPACRMVRLSDPNAGVSVKVDFPEFPHLGFWSEPGEEFICIEPWQGMDDHEEQEPFDQKVGVVALEAGAIDRRTIRVTPEFE